MLESDTPSKTFLGVRFSLFGFNPADEHKIRVKLIDGGGVGVGQYSQNCTHLVVDNIVYDDPVCVAARNDGKTVVTGLWVDHSFDIGMPVDATSIMYRPPRDLNGIPGAESLIICLTGYQRQDRDDIMTMVSLMGAHFSKPLVANKVTHLICYKFEGEKYELAKKIKRIKLINHRWLEDCLREWELLSEANYSKSGYELEMMEAEAKDSEDEAEETTSKQYGQKCLNRSPHNLKAGTLSSTELPNSAAKVPPSTVMRHSPNTKEILLTPGKCHEGTNLNNVNAPQLHAFQDAGIVKNATSIKLAEPHNRSPKSTMLDNNWVSTSKSPSLSDEKFTAISYARKTARKSPVKSILPTLSGEISGNISSSPRAMTIKDKSDISSPKMQQPEERISSCFIESPWKESGLRHGEDSAGIVPQKRGPGLSASSSKYQKMSHNAKAGVKGSALDTERLEPMSPEGDQLEINDCSVNRTDYMNVVHDACASNATTRSLSNDLPSFKTATEENRENNTDERSPKTSLRGHRESTLASKPDMQNENADEKSYQKSSTGLRELNSACIQNVGDSGLGSCGQVVGALGELQNKQQDVEVPAPDDRKLEHSHNPAMLDLLEGGNDKTVKNPPNKKMLGKKTLGSRAKLSTIANRKRSIYLSKTASENDFTICSSGAKEQLIPKSPSEYETSPSTIRMEATNNVIEKVVAESQAAAASKTLFMDDETEAPDGEDVNDYEKLPGEEKAELVESVRKAEMMVEFEHIRPDVGLDGGLVTLENETKAIDSVRMALGSENSKLGESTLKSVGSKRNATKRKKELPGKAKKKTVPSEPKSNLVAEDTSAAKNVEEKDDEKENSEPHDVAKTNTSNGSSKMENSVKADKSSSVNVTKRKKELPAKAKKKAVPSEPKSNLVAEDTSAAKNVEEKDDEKENSEPHDVSKTNSSNGFSKMENSVKADKSSSVGRKELAGKSVIKPNKRSEKTSNKSQKNAQPVEQVFNMVKTEPVWFIVSGHRLQRKEFQQVIKRLKGKCCRDSHQWSYQATHFIAPDPIRRTEKLFAAAASGRWILKTDYLSACNQAGKFLPEERYEWHQNGLSEDGAINLEAPRKWRHLRERTGHGAFYGMRIIVYGECIAPPLDTLKRVVKAGDGTILATSPPYTRFLNSGVDFAVVSPGMPRVDVWVQEFLKHKIPCVVADYLVEYVCKPGYSLERHVLYNTNEWAEKSFANLTSRAEEIVEDFTTTTPTPPDDCGSNDVSCQVCGSSEREEVMLICGDESGSLGCGVGTHIDCCDPPLEKVPQDDWFCPKCITNRKSPTPPKKRKKAASRSKGK